MRGPGIADGGANAPDQAGSRQDVGRQRKRPRVVAGQQSEPLSRVSFADPNYDQAVADLEKMLAANRGRLDPQTVQIIEDNLRTIDQAIEQSRKALRADPASVYLNNHFAASRNRKLALLRRASALAMAQDSAGGS